MERFQKSLTLKCRRCRGKPQKMSEVMLGEMEAVCKKVENPTSSSMYLIGCSPGRISLPSIFLIPTRIWMPRLVRFPVKANASAVPFPISSCGFCSDSANAHPIPPGVNFLVANTRDFYIHFIWIGHPKTRAIFCWSHCTPKHAFINLICHLVKGYQQWSRKAGGASGLKLGQAESNTMVESYSNVARFPSI